MEGKHSENEELRKQIQFLTGCLSIHCYFTFWNIRNGYKIHAYVSFGRFLLLYVPFLSLINLKLFHWPNNLPKTFHQHILTIDIIEKVSRLHSFINICCFGIYQSSQIMFNINRLILFIIWYEHWRPINWPCQSIYLWLTAIMIGNEIT